MMVNFRPLELKLTKLPLENGVFLILKHSYLQQPKRCVLYSNRSFDKVSFGKCEK